MRRQFLEGSGVPGLVAIHQDATGNALPLALAYAKGMLCWHRQQRFCGACGGKTQAGHEAAPSQCDPYAVALRAD